MPLFALSQIKNLVQDLRRLAARLRTRIRAWRNAEASSTKNREINQERNSTLVPQIDLDKARDEMGEHSKCQQAYHTHTALFTRQCANQAICHSIMTAFRGCLSTVRQCPTRQGRSSIRLGPVCPVQFQLFIFFLLASGQEICDLPAELFTHQTPILNYADGRQSWRRRCVLKALLCCLQRSSSIPQRL